MHYVFATRGVKHARDILVTQLQGMKFMRHIEEIQPDGTYKKVPQIVWGALRPIELWEFVFPEEFKDEVLTAFRADEKGSVHPFPLKIPQKVLQKALGLKPVKFKKTNAVPLHMLLPRSMETTETDGVAIYPIGIKEDIKAEWKDKNIRQEML